LRLRWENSIKMDFTEMQDLPDAEVSSDGIS
jgi:hypothetical protein